MPKPNWLVMVKRRSCSQLPRAHICIRAVHHVFHFKGELDAESDEAPGSIGFQSTSSLSDTATARGGIDVVH